MAGELVLITGGSGFVGYGVVAEALSKGYKVRAAVRSEAKAAELKRAPTSQKHADQLSFVIVPNIEVDGAFDDAVKGVDYIAHVASPPGYPAEDPMATLVRPAIRATTSILNSALKEPKIRRVVITSSVVAVWPSADMQRPFDADHVDPDPQPPFENGFSAYAAGKKLAYSATRAFIAEQKPHFSVVNVMPTFVVGKHELATTPEAVDTGSNALVLGAILGRKGADPLPAMFCHLDDVAYVHIASLDPKIQGNRNFGVNYTASPSTWEDAFDIVRKHFPNEVKSGLLPLDGSQPGFGVPFDATKTEKAFGIKFKSFEQQILDLVGYYVETAKNKA